MTVITIIFREEDSAIHFIDENGDELNNSTSGSSDEVSPSSEQQIVITINQVVFMVDDDDEGAPKKKITITVMTVTPIMTMTILITQKDELTSIIASRGGTPCHTMVDLKVFHFIIISSMTIYRGCDHNPL